MTTAARGRPNRTNYGLRRRHATQAVALRLIAAARLGRPTDDIDAIEDVLAALVDEARRRMTGDIGAALDTLAQTIAAAPRLDYATAAALFERADELAEQIERLMVAAPNYPDEKDGPSHS